MDLIERGSAIESLTYLKSYYQSKYEHYLAMATEAKEHTERVGLLLLDLSRNVLAARENSIESSLSHGRYNNGSPSPLSLDNDSASTSIGYAETSSTNSKLPQLNLQFESEESETTVVDKESLIPLGVEQARKWTLDLTRAMLVIESVSNSDSGKALHQNYLHHLINREFEQKLSSELVELYLEEAIRRGYLELDEFNNNCYVAKPKEDSSSESSKKQNKNIAIVKANAETVSGRESKSAWSKVSSEPRVARNKPYDLPPSDKLKLTLFETIEEYMEKNHPKRFSINDVINYLYPQPTQANWDKALKNKVRISISNVLCRKAYLNKHWSRIKPGIYRPKRSL